MIGTKCRQKVPNWRRIMGQQNVNSSIFAAINVSRFWLVSETKKIKNFNNTSTTVCTVLKLYTFGKEERKHPFLKFLASVFSLLLSSTSKLSTNCPKLANLWIFLTCIVVEGEQAWGRVPEDSCHCCIDSCTFKHWPCKLMAWFCGPTWGGVW